MTSSYCGNLQLCPLIWPHPWFLNTLKTHPISLNIHSWPHLSCRFPLFLNSPSQSTWRVGHILWLHILILTHSTALWFPPSSPHCYGPAQSCQWPTSYRIFFLLDFFRLLNSWLLFLLPTLRNTSNSWLRWYLTFSLFFLLLFNNILILCRITPEDGIFQRSPPERTSYLIFCIIHQRLHFCVCE